MLSALLPVADTTQSSRPDIDPQLTHSQAEANSGLSMSHSYNEMTEQTTNSVQRCAADIVILSPFFRICTRHVIFNNGPNSLTK